MGFLDRVTRSALGLETRAGRPPALSSERAPKGALARVNAFTPADLPMPDAFSGQQIIDHAYSENVYVYRCVNAIANSIVSCPFRAGDAVSNNYSINSPLARLLGPAPGSPNPNMSSAMLLRHAIVSYMLLGKFAWAIERDAVGRVVGLWPLRAQHLRPVLATYGAGYFKTFEYNNRGAENFVEYKAGDIVYVWHPSQNDFLQPESAINVARLHISISTMLDKYDYGFLKNGGVPANLVVTPPFATPDDSANFQAQFQADFSGVNNAGKTMFAEREIEGDGEATPTETVQVIPLGTTQKDAEITNLRKATNMAICVDLGVPMSILGDSTAVTFSNAFQDRRNYWLETLLPRSREIQEGINLRLGLQLDPTGKTIGWFDTTGIPELRGDPAIPALQALDWVEAGLVTADETRADIGLPPSKDVGLTGQVNVPKPPPAFAPAAPEAAPGSLQKEAGAKVVPPAKAPVATAPAASRALVSAVETLLREQSDAAHAALTGRRSKFDYNREYWTGKTKETLLAANVPSSQIENLATQITNETGDLVDGLLRSQPATGTTDNFLSQVSDLFESRVPIVIDGVMRGSAPETIAIDKVIEAILAIHSGVPVKDALAAWEVS